MSTSPVPDSSDSGSSALDARLDPLAARIERSLDRWKTFLRAEDRRCDEHRFSAALVTVGIVDTSRVEEALRLVLSASRNVDRVGMLCADEVSVLLSPVDDIHHAQKLVQQISSSLHDASIDAHIGWAMRLEGHGFFHAAARADAAMLTARGHGKMSIALPAD